MAVVVAGGLRPSAGVGCVEAAFAGASLVSAPGTPSQSKNRPHLLFIKRWGRFWQRSGRADYNARLTFIACLLYLPRYSAACMAMMRPELLAQEACEPGARETS